MPGPCVTDTRPAARLPGGGRDALREVCVLGLDAPYDAELSELVELVG
ncbi:hypothetical protein G5C60_21355 [Streptomyces sp. HC44]|uniref:Uncharacterized protein n=1 Tax=Streptomyces scabichelini TaxID=2711217 RepID=A0A6G4V7H7_9ACTN|nr:hypothetical protein [Streptomyces scabichelini]NGO10068.1 hypothetical protein [Streptomyces scabichelini]